LGDETTDWKLEGLKVEGIGGRIQRRDSVGVNDAVGGAEGTEGKRAMDKKEKGPLSPTFLGRM
jgi:hypothetical protein